LKRLENALERGDRTIREQRQPAGGDGPVEDLFEQLPYGLFTVDQSGSVLEMNGIGRELLLGDREAPLSTPLTCCDLVCDAVHDHDGDPVRCLTREALDQDAAPAEIRIELRSPGETTPAWVTVAPLRGGPGAIFHLRAEHGGGDRGESGAVTSPRLRVFALGQTRVESSVAGTIGGEWIEQRPGQVLKYLVCSRRQVADADQIAQALWPGRDLRALSSVRYFVHALRNRLEPERKPKTASAFVESRRGGYRLDPERVWIDATEFEQLVSSGLAALLAGERDAALRRLERATDLYRGDFLADEPYADWALAERDRLRELAGRALSALVELRLADGDLDLAMRQARRLAEMEPYDSDVQRQYIELCLDRGRRTEAIRRYELFRRRLAREFGDEPDFRLEDLRRGEGENAE
jgi:DNA-binding SARP family transcriptional activator